MNRRDEANRETERFATECAIRTFDAFPFKRVNVNRTYDGRQLGSHKPRTQAQIL